MSREMEKPANVIDYKAAVKDLKRRKVEKRIYFGLHETAQLHNYLKDRLGEEHELTSAFSLPKYPSARVTLKVSRRKLNQIARMLLDENNDVTRHEVGETFFGLESEFILNGGTGSGTRAYEAFVAVHYEDIDREQALDIIS